MTCPLVRSNLFDGSLCARRREIAPSAFGVRRPRAVLERCDALMRRGVEPRQGSTRRSTVARWPVPKTAEDRSYSKALRAGAVETAPLRRIGTTRKVAGELSFCSQLQSSECAAQGLRGFGGTRISSPG